MATTTRLEYKSEWIIHNFFCSANGECSGRRHDFKCHFSNGLPFTGSLSVDGGKCQNRVCNLVLNCPVAVSWKVYCVFTVDGCSRGFKRSLCQELPCTTIRLLDGDGRCAFKAMPCRIKYSLFYDFESDWKVFLIKDSKFLRDHAEFFESKKFSDVIFEVGDEEINANKCILACRSRVFEAMFEHEMIEAKSNRVVIEDIKPKVFYEMLRFIYTDTVTNLKEMASELLIASDKYDLERLKSMCVKQLAEDISIENAVEMLILADVYNAEQLKVYVMTFIAKNKNAVAETKHWKELIERNSSLLADL